MIKSTLEVIRFDAELEERAHLKSVIARLEGSTIKLSGYSESARIRASEAKDNFPKRHDWDSYFRDARNMDEKKPGERPDTIHISNLPIRWFCPRHQENEENVKPSESIFKRIFEKFGSVRMVDIPICDPFRKDMKSHMTGMKTFSFDQDLYFEGWVLYSGIHLAWHEINLNWFVATHRYVQFSEYLGFVKTMDEFRGMKLVRKDGDKNLAINITMDFDTTKHLSESSIKRRKILRDRLIVKEQLRREEELKKEQEEEAKKEKERFDSMLFYFLFLCLSHVWFDCRFGRFRIGPFTGYVCVCWMLPNSNHTKYGHRTHFIVISFFKFSSQRDSDNYLIQANNGTIKTRRIREAAHAWRETKRKAFEKIARTRTKSIEFENTFRRKEINDSPAETREYTRLGSPFWTHQGKFNVVLLRPTTIH